MISSLSCKKRRTKANVCCSVTENEHLTTETESISKWKAKGKCYIDTGKCQLKGPIYTENNCAYD